MPTILATARVGQNITRRLGQTEYVLEFAISQQPSIGGHYGRESGASGGGQNRAEQLRFRFTSRVRHDRLAIQNKLLIAISESRESRRNSVHYPVNAG